MEMTHEQASPHQQKRGKHMDKPHDPFGDVRPDAPAADPRTKGGRRQKKVEDRENVSMVTPEDYPAADREESRPK